jgi:DNA-binding transcriptional MerR regulator
MNIPDKIFTIKEVSNMAGVKPYILRYWEKEFNLIAPIKGKGGQRRYRKEDVEKIFYIKDLLYKQKYTIAGAKKRTVAEKKLNEELQSLPEFMVKLRKELKDILRLLEK